MIFKNLEKLDKIIYVEKNNLKVFRINDQSQRLLRYYI